MEILFIYRLYPGENHKGRPSYYSKELALSSFIEAYQRINCGKKLILAVDADEMPDKFKEIVGNHCECIIYFGGVGNSKSYLSVLDLIESETVADLFYISEDDYLYKLDAFVEYVNAMRTLSSIDYITLYDHPDRYKRDDNQALFGGDKIFISGDYHWRTVESTCMTFGGRINSLKKDIDIHRTIASKSNAPQDRMIWYKKLGIGRYLWRFPKRRLIAPMPSLATHLESEFLAPVVNWEMVAKNVSNNS